MLVYPFRGLLEVSGYLSITYDDLQTCSNTMQTPQHYYFQQLTDDN